MSIKIVRLKVRHLMSDLPIVNQTKHFMDKKVLKCNEFLKLPSLIASFIKQSLKCTLFCKKNKYFP